MNKVIISGNLVADPEVSVTERGMTIARYRIAVNEQVKGEKKTYFFPCVAFDKRAQFAENYFRKGKRILVSGNIQIENYTDKEGVKRLSVSVIVNDQEFADSKQSEQEVQNAAPVRQENEWINVPEDAVDDMGLPFN